MITRVTEQLGEPFNANGIVKTRTEFAHTDFSERASGSLVAAISAKRLLDERIAESVPDGSRIKVASNGASNLSIPRLPSGIELS